jgi:hypothetical protein
LCLAQDDVKKFISEPQPPPSGIEILKEGKAKERREVGEGHDTVVVTKTRRRCKTASSCGRGLAARACLMFLWYKKRVAKKLRVSETTPQEVSCLE